jgi:hypothetical protein
MNYVSASDFAHLVLGEYAEPVYVETSEANRLATLAMARQASRSLDVVSRNLDPPVYDDPALSDAVKMMVRKSRNARVRIMVQDAGPMVARGHRFIDLAQKLSSFIEIRVPAGEHAKYNSALLVADSTGFIHRTLADRYEGIVNFNDRRNALEYIRQFDEMWATATPDPNLRALRL